MKATKIWNFWDTKLFKLRGKLGAIWWLKFGTFFASHLKYLLFQSAFLKYVPGSSGVRSSSFNLRLILWEAGITVSNKVLECLILRFAKNKLLSSEAYVIVMIRLHLAHGKNIEIIVAAG